MWHKIGAGMKNRFSGPISPMDFLRHFLPKPQSPAPWTKETQEPFFAVGVAAPDGARAMCRPMVEALEPFCPTLYLMETHSWDCSLGSRVDLHLPNPDLCSYTHLGAQVTDIAGFEHIFHFKVNEHDDGFGDGELSLEYPTPSAEHTRNQLSTYATIQFALQRRTHIFSVLVVKHHARLIRWDRAGAIVTSKFLFAEEPYLAEFMWAYARADFGKQGWDTSITVISATPHLCGRLAFLVDEARRILDIPPEEPVFRFTVWDEDDTHKQSYYYGSKPLFASNRSSAGRATSGYIVIDENAKLAFLKDTWRIVSSEWIREGITYQKLREAGVRNVPTVIASGDIPGQQTVSFGSKAMNPQKHYRIVFREVASDIVTYGHTSVLVGAVRDALQAHQDAFEKARILHRDISNGNILITNEGKGLLIDWEFSEHLDEVEKGRQTISFDRNGTWAFMSARLLQAPVTPGQPIHHTLQDDLESFYHVLSWVALQHEPHQFSHTVKLQEIFARTYNYAVCVNGYLQGGTMKRSALLASTSESEEIFFDGPLKDLIRDLQRVLKVTYVRPNVLERKKGEEMAKECPEMLDGSFVWEYDTCLERLRNSRWMVERFTEAVFALRAAETSSDVMIDEVETAKKFMY
ncbi:hypothetical protein WG66_007403 [Moniliophthora roreri]|nr:hypothetical protein WG66_007403 [Moniliophthora roreri]